MKLLPVLLLCSLLTSATFAQESPAEAEPATATAAGTPAGDSEGNSAGTTSDADGETPADDSASLDDVGSQAKELATQTSEKVGELAETLDKTEAAHINPEMLTRNTAEELAARGDTLFIDGIDLWIGDREAETTLFHLYNIFKEERRTFLVTSRMNPTQSDFVIADLASRFRAAPVATIKPPDDILLGSVLIKLLSDRQLPVGNEIISYILPRMERSFVAARDIVINIDKMAYSKKKGISIPLVRQVLADMQTDEY